MSSHYVDDWDHYLNGIQFGTKIKEEHKEEFIKSVSTLRKHLGEDWLSKSKDTYHPVLWSLQTMSGGISDFLLLIWADSLSTIEKVSGFDSLLKRIRDYDSFESAVTELELASRLVKRGCKIKIEQEIENKKPDLFCKNENFEFYIEVKTMLTAEETKKANKTSRGIISACRPIFPAGIIFKPLSDSHLEEIKSILRQKTEHVISNKTDIEIDIPLVLKLYLVSGGIPGHREKYRDWYHKQEELGIIPKRNHGLLGPSDNVRQDYRIKIRVSNFAKKKQIPINKMGILVIVSSSYFFDLKDVEKFVDVIIESVYELRNIAAVVIWSQKIFADGKANVIEKDDFIFIENYLYGEIKEDIVIVKNRFCKFNFDYEILKKTLVQNTC